MNHHANPSTSRWKLCLDQLISQQELPLALVLQGDDIASLQARCCRPTRHVRMIRDTRNVRILRERL
jgi:hypothetical protein